MMAYVERLALNRVSYAIAGLVVVLVASIGLAIATAAFAVGFAAAAGFSLGCLLTMALAVPPLTVAARDVPSFSAAVFTVSYALAVLTALIAGVLQSLGAGQFVSILPIAAAAVAIGTLGAAIPHAAADQQSGRTSC